MNILELIKASLKKAGIDEKYAEKVQKLFSIEKEENIDTYVSVFKDNVLKTIQEAEEAAKDAAKKEAVSEYETTHKLKDGKPIETPTPGKVPEIVDPALKAMFDAQAKNIEILTGLVTGVVTKNKNADMLAMVKTKLKGKVDDQFIERVASRVNLESSDLDKEIEAQVNDFTEFKQALLNESVSDNHLQQMGQQEKMSVDEWAKFMDDSENASSGKVDIGLGK